MASPDRPTNHDLSQLLQERGRGFGFFEVVRLLQAANPDAAPVGHQGPVADELVRFRPPLELSFGATEIEEVWDEGGGRRFEIACRFLSLYGTASPLPVCFTEELLYEDRHGLLREFYDIFNHRLISLYYRAWEKYRHGLSAHGRADEPMIRRARILTHLERPGEPVALLRFAGLLHQQPLSELSMERVLESCLGLPIEVHSCRIRWTEIPAGHRSALGVSGCTLGEDALMGSEIRDATTTFQVVVGPLSREEHLEFLPGESRWEALHALIARLNTELDCELVLNVAPEAALPYELGTNQGGLGWTSWLGADTPELVEARGTNRLEVRQRPTPAAEVA